MNKIRAYWQENKSVWIHILILFLVTRITLSVIGAFSLTYIPEVGYQNWKDDTIRLEHPFLELWAQWDSKWYLSIAEHGYADVAPYSPARESTIAFFPLYPAIVSVVQFVVNDPLIASLLVSNIFLLLSAFLFYKLVRLDYDEAAAKRSLWYLFLFPSAYIFSAVYPESLLLFLWLASVLYARKGIWWAAGIAGFLAAFVKPQGFFIAVPLCLIYAFQGTKPGDWWPLAWKKIRALAAIRIDRNVIFTVIPCAGLAVWGYGNYLITGDFMAYLHVQQGYWHHQFTVPFVTLYQNIFLGPDAMWNSLVAIAALAILIVGYRKIPFSYWIFAFAIVLFNPATGTVTSSWRYLASVFPLMIVLAAWGKTEDRDRAILVSMAILQGCLFVFWVAGYWFLV